ncbi:MAG: hypothetical protein RXR20_36590 [Paraburkholderia sp.]|jgi:hypothetical protein|uniref:hypothetical protein n=1 Tax=Burkholderiaceae TaxID=119060 RepID=UPI0010F83328|nr:hypothetical protein [Burkholderia sp. 4M9327F10]
MIKVDLRKTSGAGNFRTKKSPSTSCLAEVKNRFIAHANMIGMRWDGLQGLAIYRDSQFEMEARRANLTPTEIPAARHAFNRAIDERVVCEFPSHPAATICRKRLEDSEAVA